MRVKLINKGEATVGYLRNDSFFRFSLVFCPNQALCSGDYCLL